MLSFSLFSGPSIFVYGCVYDAVSRSGDKRWFKYDRDDMCANKSQFVPVIFEPPCILPNGRFSE